MISGDGWGWRLRSDQETVALVEIQVEIRRLNPVFNDETAPERSSGRRHGHQVWAEVSKSWSPDVSASSLYG